MTDRLNKIFSNIKECEIFADIGCDHGYIAKAMLDQKKCKKAIISDVSQKCLQKAEELLAPYIQSGCAQSVVSDGFDKVGYCDCALIAGMGGEEICSILSRANVLPFSLILQPMKNSDKVRVLAVSLGYKIVSDRLFRSAGKYYDLIVLEKGADVLTSEEIEFGRDNIKTYNPDFVQMISIKIEKIKEYLKNTNLKEQTRVQLTGEMEKLIKYV